MKINWGAILLHMFVLSVLKCLFFVLDGHVAFKFGQKAKEGYKKGEERVNGVE